MNVEEPLLANQAKSFVCSENAGGLLTDYGMCNYLTLCHLLKFINHQTEDYTASIYGCTERLPKILASMLN
jgi:hypothetical protein